MSSKNVPDADGEDTRAKYVWERELRLWSGLILMAFVTMHLLNHALAIFGLHLMEAVQDWRIGLWRSWPGTVLLYGGGLAHMVLALKRTAMRRTLRMPWDEAAQLALGLLIPLFLIGHVSGTRIEAMAFDIDESYSHILPKLWNGRAWTQTLLVLITWGHGCTGLYHAWRWKPWFKRWRAIALVIAIMVPLLALAGFVVGAREAMALNLPPDIGPIGGSFLYYNASQAMFGGFAAMLGVVAAFLVWRLIMRRKRGIINVNYVGHGNVRLTRGMSVLDASRINHIPHPSRCGGRGRCATCRVLVVSHEGELPPPEKTERNLLEAIAAPAQVRLGCQLHPQSDMSVQILLPFLARPDNADTHEDAFRWGVEQEVSVLFVNIRAFNLLVQRQFPQDLVILLNRFTAEMTQAVEAHGGRVNTYLTDGLMAVFGLDGKIGAGSGAAIATAIDMLKTARMIDRELAGTLSIPLRIGIGIHTGPAIVARFGDAGRGQMIGAMGETVTIADKLEQATKQFLADCLISSETLKASGLRIASATPREIVIPNRDSPIIAFALREAPVEAITA